MEDKNISVPPGGERMRMGRGRARGCGDEARIQAAAASVLRPLQQRNVQVDSDKRCNLRADISRPLLRL